MYGIVCPCISAHLPYSLTMNGMYIGHYCGKPSVTGILPQGCPPPDWSVDINVLSVATARVTTMRYANADRLTLNIYVLCF